MAEDGMAFTRLLDKGLTADVSRAAWSPTMDLLALVTADGQLCVHRLNWQRLWAVTPERTLTALCWRPDGKALAAGAEACTSMVTLAATLLTIYHKTTAQSLRQQWDVCQSTSAGW